MSKSKYINTFNTTAEYDNYIESALPEFPNVGYDKEAGEVIIRRTSPNNYQIWGTTTATSNFNIRLNNTNVEVTVDTALGEFYLQGWTGTLTNLSQCFMNNRDITSIKKFALNTSSVINMYALCSGCTALTSIDVSTMNTSSVTNMQYMFENCKLTSLDLSTFNTSSVTSSVSMFINCSNLTTLNLSNWDLTNLSSYSNMFYNCGSLTDVYITVEATLMKLTNNLSSQGNNTYIPSSATIHYDNGSQVIDYKWQNNAWTPQS